MVIERVFVRTLAIALAISSAAFGQSLGDIARDLREQKAEDPAAPLPKVITNKDLPKDSDGNAAPPTAQPGAATAASAKTAADSPLAEQRAAQRAAQQRLAEERAAEQWKRQILAQKNKIANLQARIVQLHASIEAASGSVQSEYPLNRYQARQLQRMAQIQQQLGEQQRKLEQMQEAARHAGMHTVVYDP